MRRDQISIQLYTLRDLLAKDVDGTLAQVAAAGYKDVEFAGFYGKTANEIRSLLDKHGLKTSSAHIPLTDFQTRLDGVVDDLVTLGAGWGIVPWVAPDDRSEEGLKAIAAQFDGFALRSCRRPGSSSGITTTISSSPQRRPTGRRFSTR